jgi:hypothetical protein
VAQRWQDTSEEDVPRRLHLRVTRLERPFRDAGLALTIQAGSVPAASRFGSILSDISYSVTKWCAPAPAAQADSFARSQPTAGVGH